MPSHAENTRCPVAQTKGAIEAILGKYGMWDIHIDIHMGSDATVRFRGHGRRMRFRVAFPWLDVNAQAAMTTMRQLLRTIEGKLISFDSNIESFESAFMPQIVMPNGQTLADAVLPTLPDPEPEPELDTGPRRTAVEEWKVIECRFCGKMNRLPYRTVVDAKCGKCHRPLVGNDEEAA